MKTTAEIEIKVSNAKVTNAMVMPDGTCKLTVEMANAGTKVTEIKDDVFVVVEASKLSLNDEFMQYEPSPDWFAEDSIAREFRGLLEKAIKSGLKDFRRPKYDPSINDAGEICYEPGKMPAVGKSYDWWNQAAKKFKPEYNSRLGTNTEYVAFLGVLIKKLVESGWSVENAWKAVCWDSNEVGHFWNSENAKRRYFEPTGSRAICGFYDLGNCYKILTADEAAGTFWLTGGDFETDAEIYPLATIGGPCYDRESFYFGNVVGWLVLD